MARLESAAHLKEALNGLSPEDAWGDKADVERMFLGSSVDLPLSSI